MCGLFLLASLLGELIAAHEEGPGWQSTHFRCTGEVIAWGLRLLVLIFLVITLDRVSRVLGYSTSSVTYEL